MWTHRNTGRTYRARMTKQAMWKGEPKALWLQQTDGVGKMDFEGDSNDL